MGSHFTWWVFPAHIAMVRKFWYLLMHQVFTYAFCCIIHSAIPFLVIFGGSPLSSLWECIIACLIKLADVHVIVIYKMQSAAHSIFEGSVNPLAQQNSLSTARDLIIGQMKHEGIRRKCRSQIFSFKSTNPSTIFFKTLGLGYVLVEREVFLATSTFFKVAFLK